MAESSAKFNLVIGAVDHFTAPFKNFGQAMDSGAGKLKKLGKEFRDLKKSLDKNLGFSQTKVALNGLGKGFAGVGGEAKKLLGTLSTLGAIGGLAGGGLAGGIYKLGKDFADAGAQADEMAQKLSLTAQEWQSMAYAAKMNGVEASVLQGSYEKLNQNLVAAASGGKAQAAAFKTLGVGLKSLNEPGKLKKTDQLMTELAEAFSKLPNDAKKAGLATQIFGAAGTKMLPLLNKGAAGLDELRQKAIDYGLVFEGEGVAAGAAFNESLDDTKLKLTGLGYSIGRSFLPTAQGLVNIFGDLVDENRALIKTKTAEWAKKLTGFLPKIKSGLSAVVKAIPAMLTKINGFARALGGWENIAKGAALVMAGPLAKSILGLAGPIKSLGVAIMTTPLGLLLGIGSALAALMIKSGALKPFLDGVSEGFSSLSGGLSEAFVELLTSVRNLFGEIGDSLFKANGEINPEAWRDLGKAVGEFVNGTLGTLITMLKEAVGLLKSLGEGLGNAAGLIATGQDVGTLERANQAEAAVLAELESKRKAGTLTSADLAASKDQLSVVSEMRRQGKNPLSSVFTAPSMSYEQAPKKAHGVAMMGRDRVGMAPNALSGGIKEAVKHEKTEHTEIIKNENTFKFLAPDGWGMVQTGGGSLPEGVTAKMPGSYTGQANSGG